MAKIHKTSDAVKSAIRRKSAYSLPDNPTASGLKANDIKNAFYKPVIDVTNSALTEIDRVVDEVNSALGLAATGTDFIKHTLGSRYFGSDGWCYTFSGNDFTVAENDAQLEEVVIPSFVYYKEKYYPVVAIAASAFRGNLITVEIPSSVVKIGDLAFRNCSQLSSVVFRGDTSLGDLVFPQKEIVCRFPAEFANKYYSSLRSYGNIECEPYATVESNISAIENLKEVKLNKIKTTSNNERVYGISKAGGQITRKLVTTPTDGEIPAYLTGGRIPVNAPQADNDATPKSYVEGRLESMGAYIAFSIDPTNYKMTIQLKNENGTVLSSGTVDLPIESMILGAKYADGILSLNIKTADDSLNNTSINVNISDLISGLVNEETFISEVQRLEKSISDAIDSNKRAEEYVEQYAVQRTDGDKKVYGRTNDEEGTYDLIDNLDIEEDIDGLIIDPEGKLPLFNERRSFPVLAIGERQLLFSYPWGDGEPEPVYETVFSHIEPSDLDAINRHWAEKTFAKKTDVSSVYRSRGSVSNYDDLPESANVGDVYNVENAFLIDGKEYPAGTNVVRTESGWDALGGMLDLSNTYVKQISNSETDLMVYARSGKSENKDVSIRATPSAVKNSIVRRNANGTFNVGIPTSPSHPATKEYVDSKKLYAHSITYSVPNGYVDRNGIAIPETKMHFTIFSNSEVPFTSSEAFISINGLSLNASGYIIKDASTTSLVTRIIFGTESIQVERVYFGDSNINKAMFAIETLSYSGVGYKDGTPNVIAVVTDKVTDSPLPYA